MLQILEHTDNSHHAVAPLAAQSHKAELGQFMTPTSIAHFMASLFPATALQTCKLLDAGAGVGALSCAFLDRWMVRDFSSEKIEVCAYEVDPALQIYLQQNLETYSKQTTVKSQIVIGDFIEHAAMLCEKRQRDFTHIIMNPPYKKINSHSKHRLILRSVGIETVNLYSAFIALAVELAAPGGQLVAIIPRSFCNGPYYKPFREFILARTSIRHIHLFHSRSKAFKEDSVLQENVILLLERDGEQSDVTISTSTDDSFVDLITHTHPFERIVFPNDSEYFIQVPTTPEHNSIERSAAICYSLEDIGIKVSTGPVVDFRLKEHLRDMPKSGTVPLLYPTHFAGQNIEWPKPDSKKPNAIIRNTETEKWLYPNGFYCVVRRFSSKEEKRRIVASVVQPHIFGDANMLGLENHLNVYHENKQGLPETLARGLAIYLNSTDVDENFRRSSGHTQVNATDLRVMKYPSREKLMALGEWAMHAGEPTQTMIDEQLDRLIA